MSGDRSGKGLSVQVEDRLLVWRLNRGDAMALSRVYEKYREDLLRLATALLNNPATAEDVVQDVFVRFAGSARVFRLTGSLKTCSEQFHLVSQALEQLPAEQREAVTLHLYGEMSFREIAGWQKMSIKTVQSRYHYGLAKLRSVLNGEVTQ